MMIQIFLAILIIGFLVLFGILSIPLKNAAKEQNEKPKLKTTRLE